MRAGRSARRAGPGCATGLLLATQCHCRRHRAAAQVNIDSRPAKTVSQCLPRQAPPAIVSARPGWPGRRSRRPRSAAGGPARRRRRRTAPRRTRAPGRRPTRGGERVQVGPGQRAVAVRVGVDEERRPGRRGALQRLLDRRADAPGPPGATRPAPDVEPDGHAVAVDRHDALDHIRSRRKPPRPAPPGRRRSPSASATPSSDSPPPASTPRPSAATARSVPCVRDAAGQRRVEVHDVHPPRAGIAPRADQLQRIEVELPERWTGRRGSSGRPGPPGDRSPG